MGTTCKTRTCPVFARCLVATAHPFVVCAPCDMAIYLDSCLSKLALCRLNGAIALFVGAWLRRRSLFRSCHIGEKFLERGGINKNSAAAVDHRQLYARDAAQSPPVQSAEIRPARNVSRQFAERD